MRAVVQRVAKASVTVDGATVGTIKRGLLVYLGIASDDTEKDLNYITDKISGLRIFPSSDGLMNLSVLDVSGEALIVSQFTLQGDVRRGRRPSFSSAMPPDKASVLYERLCERLRQIGLPCERGVFGAMMQVASINDGPVTILIDSRKLF